MKNFFKDNWISKQQPAWRRHLQDISFRIGDIQYEMLNTANPMDWRRLDRERKNLEIQRDIISSIL